MGWSYGNETVDRLLKNIAVRIARQEFNEELTDYFYPAAYLAGRSREYCAQNLICHGNDFVRSKKGKFTHRIFEKYLPEYLDYGKAHRLPPLTVHSS